MDAINRITPSAGGLSSQAVKERRVAVPAGTDGKAEPSREEVAKKKQQELESQQRTLREQLESANRQSEALKETAEVEGKCLTIAMRIMSGDTVPQQDYRYLAKNNSGLYARAITLRVERSDPRKYKRVSEDEKQDDAVAQMSKALGGDTHTSSDSGAEADLPKVEGAADSVPVALNTRA